MEEIEIRECRTIEEFDSCVRLQRAVFGLSDLEISPRRHLIVSRQAGGWTLGAFLETTERRLIGFVHHLIAVREHDEIIGYSHMMAVARDYQDKGIGTRLKWAQRERAVAEGRRFIQWTWDPMQSRNAHFNLNRLGVTVRVYAENFYGTDYVTDPAQRVDGVAGIDSDRLIAAWDLNSRRVVELSAGARPEPPAAPANAIAIPAQFNELLRHDAPFAKKEQLRVREEFKKAFNAGLVCAGFERGSVQSRYLLYDSK